MKNKIFGFQNLMILGLFVLGACAQSRRSVTAGQPTDELWEPVALTTNEAAAGASTYNTYGQTSGFGNYGALGSFELQLNISRNSAYLAVSSLGFNSTEVPYRVLARGSGSSNFVVLKDNVAVGAGGEIEVFAAKGDLIKEYETWRVEMVINYDAQNYEVRAPAGMGLVVVQQTVDFPELYEQSNASLNSRR